MEFVISHPRRDRRSGIGGAHQALLSTHDISNSATTLEELDAKFARLPEGNFIARYAMAHSRLPRRLEEAGRGTVMSEFLKLQRTGAALEFGGEIFIFRTSTQFDRFEFWTRLMNTLAFLIDFLIDFHFSQNLVNGGAADPKDFCGSRFVAADCPQHSQYVAPL